MNTELGVPPLNRLLLTDVPMREVHHNRGRMLIKDGSALPYLIEEFVALSAVEVLIPDRSIPAEFVDGLAPPLRERVRVVTARRAYQASHAFCAPLAEELGLSLDRGAITTTGEFGATGEAFAALYVALPTFLLGVEYQVQIDVNVGAMTRGAQTLREHSRNTRTRATMAALEGLLRTYQRTEQPGLVVTSTASAELVRLFRHLIEDETYRRMSASAHSLGLPGKGARALQLLRQLAEDLISRRPFRHLLRVGTRAIETVTHVPLPDSDAIAELIGSGYLPPVVTLNAATEKALRLWREHAPPLIPPQGMQRHGTCQQE